MVDPSQGLDAVADIFVEGGRIADILLSPGPRPQVERAVDARNRIVAPGFVDMHAHLRYPGSPDKETMASGTSAAIRGGFTTVCAMANTDPPVDRASRVEEVAIMARTEARCRVEIVGAVTMGLGGRRRADARDLVSAGAIGLSDDGNPVMDAGLMRSALRSSERFGVPISVHEEIRETSDGPDPCWPCPGESRMVERDLQLVREVGGRLHVAHVSCAQSIEKIAEARARGLAVTAEVTPHHLLLTDALRDGDGTLPSHHGLTKVNPPLRSDSDRVALLEALASGVVQAIATDHAPHSGSHKVGGLLGAAFGFTGFELALPQLLGLVRERWLNLDQVIERLTSSPAQVLGLPAGSLRKGSRADVCIFDPGAQWIPGRDTLASKGKNTPLIGRGQVGRVCATIVGGTIYEFDSFHELRAIRTS